MVQPASCFSQVAAHPTLVSTAHVRSKGMGTSAPVTHFGKELTVVSTDYGSFGFPHPISCTWITSILGTPRTTFSHFSDLVHESMNYWHAFLLVVCLFVLFLFLFFFFLLWFIIFTFSHFVLRWSMADYPSCGRPVRGHCACGDWDLPVLLLGSRESQAGFPVLQLLLTWEGPQMQDRLQRLVVAFSLPWFLFIHNFSSSLL